MPPAHALAGAIPAGRRVLALIAVLAALLALPVTAGAATFTVTTNADSGEGSFRQAILDANVLPYGEEDVIAFDLSDPTITPSTPLPPITGPVLIDGLTQPGAQAPGSDLEFDGELPVRLMGTAGTGLQTATGGGSGTVTIRGLRIEGFSAGVESVASNLAVHVVASEVIGSTTDRTGHTGVVLGPGDVLGGEALADATRVANAETGVRVAPKAGAGGQSASVTGSFVQANGVGVELTTAASVTGNLIGSPVPGGQGTGVRVLPTTGSLTLTEVSANAIVGNTVGLDIATDSVMTQANIIDDNLSHGVVIRGAIDRVSRHVVDSEIMGNGGAGVAVLEGTGGFVFANSIDGNGGLGIDLGADGPTPNDPLDADEFGPSGLLPNHGLNAPVIDSATTTGATTTVRVHLEGQPGARGAIEIYASPSCDPSGSGEGARPLVMGGVAAGADGRASISFAGPSLPDGTAVTALTVSGGSSEFSRCVLSGPPAPGQPASGGSAVADRTRPRLSGLRLVPSTFAPQPAAARSSVVRGSSVRFRLSEAAQVELRVARRLAGRTVNGRCRAVTRRNRSRRRCVRTVVVGRLNHAGTAGANRIAFSGRVAGRALARGSYGLTARAVDAGGNAATPQTARFRIVAARARR